MKILDQKIIYRHLADLEKGFSYLKSKKNTTVLDIINNYEERLAIERAFHLCIQNILDVGGHILASLNVNNIETYADIPQKLYEKKILAKGLSERIVKMAKLRNILVHEYIKLESEKLVHYLKHNVGDFELFVQAVGKFLKRSK